MKYILWLITDFLSLRILEVRRNPSIHLRFQPAVYNVDILQLSLVLLKRIWTGVKLYSEVDMAIYNLVAVYPFLHQEDNKQKILKL